jgi:Uma2 family endonuclease
MDSPEEYSRIRRTVDALSQTADALQAGWSFEIAESGVLVMMSPSKRHEGIATRIVSRISRQLGTTDPDTDLVAHAGTTNVEDPAIGRLRQPDVLVVPLHVLDEPGDTVDPRDIVMVAEIVSPSNPENDWEGKTSDYAAMGIPIYMVVDPRKSEGVVAVHSDPGPGPHGAQYRTRRDYSFGDTVAVGPWTLETADFPRYDN